MSVTKRIYVLFALCAVGFAASACSGATGPDASASRQTIERTTCEQTGSTVCTDSAPQQDAATPCEQTGSTVCTDPAPQMDSGAACEQTGSTVKC
jgi:hypothetical protein